MTAEEYAEQTKALHDYGNGSSSGVPDIGVITAVKAISYRVIVSISHIFVDYYWTGNYVAAGALEVLQITINSTQVLFPRAGVGEVYGRPARRCGTHARLQVYWQRCLTAVVAGCQGNRCNRATEHGKNFRCVKGETDSEIT